MILNALNFKLASSVPTECNAIICGVIMGGFKSLGGFSGRLLGIKTPSGEVSSAMSKV